MDFTFISGNLGLDLAGTVGHRRRERIDLLATPGDLARWTVAAGLLDERPAVSDGDLAEARALREAIYRLACAARTGSAMEAGDRETLNAAARHAPASVLLGERGVERGGDVRAALASTAEGGRPSCRRPARDGRR
uniref:Uncharacterized protein n=1 Tax=Nonomuraea gerenzanensis TaxID=93944 RepID=A0A1M4EIG1_9ACTN|nr:ABATE domain-containing protein [Nonomuraea gerenzanensis]SBO98468.1 hypothetical protein BN4615_P7984 [Nonomuraea gerenzanensis]